MSRKLWLGLAIAAVAVLAFGATTASAHTESFNTDVDIHDIDFVNGSIRIEGDVHSPRAQCERFRRVVGFAIDEDTGEVTFIDADFTNLEGDYVLFGDLPQGTDAVRVVAVRDVRGSGDHRHVCQADSERRELRS